MALNKNYKEILKFVTPKDHQRRAVAFLIFDDSRVTAKHKFDKLKQNDERHFRKRFEAWIDGKINNDWYHGWDKSEFSGRYTKCFVFEYKSKGHRFYGFLCHPDEKNLRYQLCVLINYTKKQQYRTNTLYLEAVEDIRTTLKIQIEIKKLFKENQ